MLAEMREMSLRDMRRFSDLLVYACDTDALRFYGASAIAISRSQCHRH